MTKADETVPVRVVRAAGTVRIAEAVQRATEAAAAGECVLVAGLVPRAYHTPGQQQAWQFSLSRWGWPPIVVSVHHYKRDAEAQVVRVNRASGTRDVRDDATFATLIQELAAFGDGEAV
ncbi:MAG TPA: hypothetical protein VLA19_29635 [Herpetosiphonaceae bacterium]|nr:hypothetical protein [Herpetosiphonaceae bacterium]